MEIALDDAVFGVRIGYVFLFHEMTPGVDGNDIRSMIIMEDKVDFIERQRQPQRHRGTEERSGTATAMGSRGDAEGAER